MAHQFLVDDTTYSLPTVVEGQPTELKTGKVVTYCILPKLINLVWWNKWTLCLSQGLVKGEKFFRHGESTSTASQLTSPASQKSQDINKVSLLLQDLCLSV